jgi:hypothetical protein
VDQWLDWSAFGFLALLTLLDGLRRVPAGALVLRKILGGNWEVVELREGYRMVSWWPPLSTSILIRGDGGTAEPRNGGSEIAEQLEQRVAMVRRPVWLLTALGAMSLVSLVVVVPVSMRWWGGMGFLSSLLLVLVVSWLATGLSFYFGKRLGLTTRQRILFALPRMNPFAAPAAGEALLERALGGAEPLAVAKLLMEEREFVRWIRPQVYDAAQGIEVEREEEFVQVVGRKQMKVILSTRPLGVAAHSPWCPRCGSEFGSASTVCPACEIPLKI